MFHHIRHHVIADRNLSPRHAGSVPSFLELEAAYGRAFPTQAFRKPQCREAFEVLVDVRLGKEVSRDQKRLFAALAPHLPPYYTRPFAKRVVIDPPALTTSKPEPEQEHRRVELLTVARLAALETAARRVWKKLAKERNVQRAENINPPGYTQTAIIMAQNFEGMLTGLGDALFATMDAKRQPVVRITGSTFDVARVSQFSQRLFLLSAGMDMPDKALLEDYKAVCAYLIKVKRNKKAIHPALRNVTRALRGLKPWPSPKQG